MDRMPEALLEPGDNTVATMPIGEWRWVLPWEMRVDLERRAYLNAWADADPINFSPERLRVLREGERSWVVDLSRIQAHRWMPREGVANDPWRCPVVRIEGVT